VESRRSHRCIQIYVNQTKNVQVRLGKDTLPN
jgi:hypothetical protein